VKRIILLILGLLNIAYATDYHVGPNQKLITIAEVPWTPIVAEDHVYIHWRKSTYKEKWVINSHDTAANRIEIIGISGPNGKQPIIDGDGATTPPDLDFWNENRGVIKIGGSRVPPNRLSSFIPIENLEIKAGHPNLAF
jgi:hypothetical protein